MRMSRHEINRPGFVRGAVTVYCSLVLLLMAALIGSLLEHAHQTGIRVRMTQAAASGLDNLFSMYDTGLYEQYGLLFLNEDLLELSPDDQLTRFLELSANPSAGLLVKTPQLLSFELEEVQLDAVYHATDDEGVFLEREVLELMKYQETAALFGQLRACLEQITNANQAYSYVVDQNESYEQTDWEELAREAGGDTAQEDTKKGEAGGTEVPEVSNQDIEASLDGSIITQVKALLTDTLLSLFVRDLSVLSEKGRSETAAFTVSHGISAQTVFLTDTASNILYDEYLMQYMGSYLHPSEAGGVAYELEYIIGGGQTDKENLLAVTTKLLLARMGLNIVFLLANHSCYEEAALLADTLVGWTGLIALVTVVKLLLIAVWAFSESVLDVRALLSGEKVAFFKTAESWTTTISDCIARVAAGEKAKESRSGFGYEMYLRIFLLMQEMPEKCLRTMNVIEWNLGNAPGRKGFSFSHCIYGLEITVIGMGRPVFYSMYGSMQSGADGYGYSVRWSQTY